MASFKFHNTMRKGKYLNLWRQKLPIILSAIKKGGSKEQLSSKEFQQNGDREKAGYGFRLDITNGIVPTKSNTAVARDLKEILDSSSLFKDIAQNKQITIRMGIEFILTIEVYRI